MTIAEALLPDFDREMDDTRKTLERLPEDKFGWKPHEKSFTMGRLATHLANLPTWAVATLNQTSLDLAPPGAPPHRPPEISSRRGLLEEFDKNVAAARSALAVATDDHLTQTWTLLAGGRQIFALPRFAVLRRAVISHIIHHRAQLGVYLRLTGVPVPAIYGPSADEGGM